MIAIERLSLGPLGNLSLTLDRGLHVVLGRDDEGTIELVSALVGSEAPRSGRVRIAGRDPRRSPETRRRIAALRAEETLFPSRTIHGAVATALAAQHLSANAAEVLQNAGLLEWAERNPTTLSRSERRAVALALAFAVEAPLVAVLHDPLRYLPGVTRERVRRKLERWLEQGTSVVCTTSSPRAAHDLGGSAWLLEQGRITRNVMSNGAFDFAPGLEACLRVRTSAARELGAALAKHPAVSSVVWDEHAEPFELRLQGPKADALALALARAALSERIAIWAITPVIPNLDVTRAASAGYLRAAYEAAYHAGHVSHGTGGASR